MAVTLVPHLRCSPSRAVDESKYRPSRLLETCRLTRLFKDLLNTHAHSPKNNISPLSLRNSTLRRHPPRRPHPRLLRLIRLHPMLRSQLPRYTQDVQTTQASRRTTRMVSFRSPTTPQFFRRQDSAIMGPKRKRPSKNMDRSRGLRALWCFSTRVRESVRQSLRLRLLRPDDAVMGH